MLTKRSFHRSNKQSNGATGADASEALQRPAEIPIIPPGNRAGKLVHVWFAGAKEIVYYNQGVDCFIQSRQNSCSILNSGCTFQLVEDGAALLAN
jgi:hypothetical protein